MFMCHLISSLIGNVSAGWIIEKTIIGTIKMSSAFGGDKS